MRTLLASLFVSLLIAALVGCGGGVSVPSSSLPTPNAAGSPLAVAGKVGANRTLGEAQFLSDATLRVNLLSDVVVDRLEPASARPEPYDSGAPGFDLIPVKLAQAATFTLTVDSPAVDHAVLCDRFMNELGIARVGAPCTVTLGTDDYILELHSATSATATVFIWPTERTVASRKTGTAAAASGYPTVVVSALPPSVTGVSTSTGAFVGDLASGPLNEPVLVGSWNDFVRTFGGLDPARPTAAQVYQFFTLGGQRAYVVRATPEPGGGVPSLTSFDGALAALPGGGAVNLLLVPDAARLPNPPDGQLATRAVARAEALGALALLEVPAGCATPGDAYQWMYAQPQLRSTWAAIYYGQITVNSDGGTPLTLGAGGTIAGLLAYNDQRVGFWHGLEARLPSGNVTRVPALTGDEGDLLRSIDINPGITMVSGGLVEDGNLTAGGTVTPSLSQVQQRRVDNYITQSLTRGLQWVVFAPNDGTTWVTVKTTALQFLTGLWTQGGLPGASAGDSFSVACGLGSTMTSLDILNGYLILQVEYENLQGGYLEHRFTEQTQGVQ